MYRDTKPLWFCRRQLRKFQITVSFFSILLHPMLSFSLSLSQSPPRNKNVEAYYSTEETQTYWLGTNMIKFSRNVKKNKKGVGVFQLARMMGLTPWRQSVSHSSKKVSSGSFDPFFGKYIIFIFLSVSMKSAFQSTSTNLKSHILTDLPAQSSSGKGGREFVFLEAKK